MKEKKQHNHSIFTDNYNYAQEGKYLFFILQPGLIHLYYDQWTLGVCCFVSLVKILFALSGGGGGGQGKGGGDDYRYIRCALYFYGVAF